MKTSDIIITLEREGVFSVGWTHSHAHQCGNVGTSVLSYKVSISARACDCNDEGWILDNNDIPQYFALHYKKVTDFWSCEQIAQLAVKHLKQQAEAGGATIAAISVGISGISGSLITASWRQP